MPRQWSPYHLRLDWLMWFLPLSSTYAQPWLMPFCTGLLTNDQAIIALLRTNPFPDAPPDPRSGDAVQVSLQHPARAQV